MDDLKHAEFPHRRFNPLNGEWVLVSPHRMKRPWQGASEKIAPEERPAYDPRCYLCPGNTRANGEKNPDYTGTYAFENDFRALLDNVPPEQKLESPLFEKQNVNGTCRVLCFSHRHDLTLAEMEPGEIQQVIAMWINQSRELAQKYKWIQIFENKGEIMGCSNPHPHGQIWASDALPTEPAKEDLHQLKYFRKYDSLLLQDYVHLEMEKGQRVIASNDDWAIVVPFWAVWPFETLLLPRFFIQHIYDLNAAQEKSLAEILKKILVRYDNLFESPFPYSMGWHGAPEQPKEQAHWQLHAHFYPPLLRSATVKKFQVGYEMLSEAQRDLTPELAALKLKSLPEIHYKFKNDEDEV
ncbi:UDP-glucose--hexose-1-phosphate uridylyltransferase [Candidatus Sumerlaeota bacterium]|nr:UDP-glucose--hexose-1-phosphate uridylyltransferase [Candidatus Sumerlaeota bacterium]